MNKKYLNLFERSNEEPVFGEDFITRITITRLKENNKRIEEIMNKKGIKSTDDIKCLIKDEFGNVLDVIPK